MEYSVVQLQLPMTMIVAGSQSSGKTTFIKKLIAERDKMFNKPITKVYYHYQVWQPGFVSDDIAYHQGVPNIDDIEPGSLLIIDDLMTQMKNDKNLMDLFCVQSHHKNIGVIFVSQQFFFDSPIMRCISRNSMYLVFFRSPRMLADIEHVSRQIWPGRKGFLADAYQKITKRPFSYLFLNLHPSADPKLAVLTDILPSEGYTRVFV